MLIDSKDVMACNTALEPKETDNRKEKVKETKD